MNAISPVPSSLSISWICFIDILDRSFADHGHRFIPFKRASSRVEGAKSQYGFDQSLNVAMVLFNPVIEIRDRSELVICRQRCLFCKLINGWRLGCILVHIDHPGRLSMTCLQGLLEKAFGRFGQALGTPPKIKGIAVRICGPIEIFLLLADFNVSLIDAPGVMGRTEMRSAACVQFRGILQESTVDRAVVSRQAVLGHHCF